MNTLIERTLIRAPFENLVSSLTLALNEERFRYIEIPDFQHNITDKVLSRINKTTLFCVYNSVLYKEMVTISPREGIILPCYVSVIETSSGETTVISFNPIQLIAKDMQNPPLCYLADEVSRRLNLIISNLKLLLDCDPDLVTSWS